jgi:hypothetical protein
MGTYVPFITIDDADDLVVSFGLGEHSSTSLTLLRTPKYESLIPEEERGVSVRTEASSFAEPEMLRSVRWSGNEVEIETTVRRYVLDVRSVINAEMKEARAVLAKMNFDRCFVLTDV